MFKKIMFATSASPACDDAANVAFDMARRNEAELHVFHVLGLPTRGFSPFVRDVRTGDEADHDDEYHAWVKEEIRNTYARQLETAGDVELVTSVGVPHTEILRYARLKDVDLIIMGSNTRGENVGAARFKGMAGSTVQRVSKAARCPVLIVSRPCTTCWSYFSNIVFGTDFSKASWSAFLFAYKVAKTVGCKLHIFHALDLRSEESADSSQGLIEEHIEEIKGRMARIYGKAMKGFDNYEIEVWEGVPYVEILKFARERKADLVVMAHHAKNIDPEDVTLGRTVEQVALRSACPVASVTHPDKVEEAEEDSQPARA